MAQRVKLLENPYWVLFKNKGTIRSQSLTEMEGIVARVIGSYFVPKYGQMWICEYQDPQRNLARALVGVVHLGVHVEHLGDAKKAKQYQFTS